MSVAPLPPEFARGRAGVRISERRPKPSARRPFAAEAAEEEFMWELVQSLSDLRGYARRLTGDSSDASDLVQETCRRALESR